MVRITRKFFSSCFLFLPPILGVLSSRQIKSRFDFRGSQNGWKSNLIKKVNYVNYCRNCTTCSIMQNKCISVQVVGARRVCYIEADKTTSCTSLRSLYGFNFLWEALYFINVTVEWARVLKTVLRLKAR